MACNTLHKAYDIVEKDLPSDIPFLHIVRLTRDFCLEKKVRKVLFLGTAFTMSDDYFILPLREADIEVVLPTAEDQVLVHEAHAEVSQGRVTVTQKEVRAQLIDHYPDVDAVILACTELPLIAPASTPQRLIINPAELQCRAAVEFALVD